MASLQFDLNTFAEPPFQLSNYTNILDTRVYRNFEELICERGDNSSSFTDVYEKIKTKLFILNEQSDVPEIEDDYLIYIEVINELKTKISKIYLHKIEKERIYIDAKEKYQNFSENITITVQSIDNVGSSVDQTSFKEILLQKIDEYYSDLNLDILKKEYNSAVCEFDKLKNVFTKLASVLPPTTCQICLENQVEFYIDPCGHTLCSQCKVKCEQNTNCHYCRVRKSKYCKLFL